MSDSNEGMEGQGQGQNQGQVPMQQMQPIIYIINADPGMGGNGNRGGFFRPRRRYYGGGGFWYTISRVFYFVKGIITFVLIAGVIFVVVTILTRPDILQNLFLNIIRKAGLYKGFMQLKRLLGR